MKQDNLIVSSNIDKKYIPIKNDDEIRECKQCGKRFILELGFYKNGDNYRTVCKKCKCANDIKRVQIERNGYDHHKYDENISGIDVCTRCGQQRRKRAAMNAVNVWIIEYKVYGKWQKERPKCSR